MHKSKFVCLEDVMRLVKHARACAKYSPCPDIWFNELIKWLNDPVDIEPIEVSDYYVSTVVTDLYKNHKDDILKCTHETELGKLKDFATLRSIRHEKEAEDTVYTYGLLVAKLPEYLIWSDTLKEELNGNSL